MRPQAIDDNLAANNKLFFENLLTIEDLASALALAPQTIRNWVSLRKIPFIRIGNRTMFRQKSIEAWLEQKEFKAWQ